MANLIRKFLLPSLVYCLACFVISQVFYRIMLTINPVPYQLGPRGWMASFLFVGVSTVVLCSGGMVGLWVLICSTTSQHKDHLKAAVLIGVITSSLMLLGFTMGEDKHLMLGTIFVSCTTLVFALVVKIYSPPSVV